MKIAITGGTGFVGSHLARALTAAGHQVVLVARGHDQRDTSIRTLPGITFVATGLNSPDTLAEAFAGCHAIAHCAGINREKGSVTYQSVHVQGTRTVVQAAQRAGVPRLLLVSFLRARPNCASGYHESKFAAEEIVRASGLDYTILKEGITYGLGDHMVSHLNWALSRLPVFAFVGLKESAIRPVHISDMVRIMVVALTEGRLSRQTVAVMGPEIIPLSEAVNRVSAAIGKRPLVMLRLPVWFHKILAHVWEATMSIPLASRAQVRMLQEGLAEPLPATPEVDADLRPRTRLTRENILAAIPIAH